MTARGTVLEAERLVVGYAGVDVTVLSLMPVVLTLYLGVVALPVLVVQAVISGGVFLVVAMTNPHR